MLSVGSHPPHSDGDRADASVEQATRHFLSTIPPDLTLGLAVSGGSDSTGLLMALARLADPARLTALTVDHRLRSESAAEARQVEALCRSLGVAHETLRWEGEKPVSGIQAAAREARLALLASAAQRHRLGAVLVGHTADDQDETLAMRRARSDVEGTPGLAGIPPATLVVERTWFLRPFLGLRRAEIRTWLAAQGSGWIDDPSNEDMRFERVRVRRNGADANHRSVAAARRQRLARSQEIAGVIDASCRRERPDTVIFDPAGLAPERREAVLHVLVDLTGGRRRAIDRNGGVRLKAFVADARCERMTLGRTLIERRGGRVHLVRERRDLPEVRVAPGQTVIWDGRFRISHRGRSEAVTVAPAEGRGALPQIVADGRKKAADITSHGEPGEVVGVERLIGRASSILPVFELPQAQALMRLVGRPALPGCPWRGWRESEGL